MKNTIKEKRKALKLTQQELANQTGVTRQTILAVEHNKYVPSLQLAFNIAKALKTDLQDVFIDE
ncbi:helix-turn-helix transcriptional regulator [Erysipelothrix rhusiopathiae]|nr:helix-turn-helix transcriptional regulator [Erysipelothrix rhusiopathiae]